MQTYFKRYASTNAHVQPVTAETAIVFAIKTPRLPCPLAYSAITKPKQKIPLIID